MRKHLSIFALLLCAFCGLAQEANHYYVAANVPCTMIRSGTQDPLSFSTYSVTAQGYYSTTYMDPGNPYTSLMLNGNTLTAQAPEGYRFLGWYTKSSGWIPGQYESDPPPATVESATDRLSTDSTLTDDVAKRAGTRRGIPIVFAKFIPVYAITVGVEPEAAGRATRSPAQDLYDKGTEVGLTAVVTNAAYKLAYWKKGNNKVSGSDGKLSLQITATADAAYTAYFTNKTYTVTFHDPSATFSDEVQTVTHGQPATAPSWSRTGYKSPTWDKSFSSVTATMTVNAQWTAEQYTVTFHDPSGVNADVVRTVSYGQSASAPSWSRTGYKSPTWDKNFSNVTANTTVNAQWTPETYTITYNGLKQGATNPNSATYTIETTPITFQPPTGVTGFTFSEWSPASIEKGTTGNKTVTASYLTWIERPTPAQYELTYNGGMQTIASGSNMSASGNQATVPGAHTATFKPNSGYCWNDGTVASYSFNWKIVNASIENATVTQSGTLTYTGEPQQPQVYADATVKGSQAVTWKYSKSPGDYAATMPSFTAAGTHKVYFEVSAQYHNPAYGSFDVVINRARTAVVTVTPRSLRYTRKDQGPTVTVQHCHEIADSVKRATEVGTYAVKASPDENYAWSDGETETRTFEWSIVDSLYTVQFDGNDGTGEMASTNLAYNEEYEVPECEFTKTGCEFQRWQVLIDSRVVTNYTAGIVVSNLTSVAGKFVTFKAEWTSYYTIAYDGNGATNTVMATQLVERDVTTNLAANAYVRPGYGFLGWDDAVNKKRYEDGAAVRNIADVGETNTLKAAWSTNTYSVVFFGNGGTNTMEAQDFVYDVPQKLRQNAFIRTGYDFAGWALDPADDVRYGDQDEVVNLTDENRATVALYARWTARGGGLDNEWSVAADCATNLADRTALALVADGECSVETGTDAGGNGKFVSLMPVTVGLQSKSAKLSALVSGTGTLVFSYKVHIDDYQGGKEATSDNNLDFWVSGESQFVGDEGWTNVSEWAEFAYPKTTPEAATVEWLFTKRYDENSDYAHIDNIRWIPDEHDAGTVGVTFRLEDGSVFSNMTCVAEAAIGELPTPIDDAGRTFLGWRYQGSVIDADWKVPADDDGVNLIAKWDSGEHPVPVDGKDNVTISSAAVADGKFTLSFKSDEDFDYSLLTNANLLIDSWGVMATEKGTGGDITFEPQIIEGQPQLFYKVDTIQKK